MKYASDLRSIKVFDSVAIDASGTSTSMEILAINIQGFFSLEWVITGDGTVKFEVLPSNSGSNFLNTEPDIATGQTKITGPGTDGKNFTSFEIPACHSFKIICTETGGADAVVVSAWLKAQ